MNLRSIFTRHCIGSLLLGTLLLGTPSCEGTETGNPGGIQMRLISSEPERIALSEGASPALELTITEAAVHVGALRLFGCEQQVTQLAQDVRVSLLDGKAVFSVPPGTYCGLSLGFGSSDLGEASPLVVRGVLANELSLSVDISLAEEAALSLTETAPEQLEVTADTQLLLVIDAAEVFFESALSDFASDTSINDEDDAWLADLIRESFRTQFRLYEDTDADGEVDPGSEPVMTSM